MILPETVTVAGSKDSVIKILSAVKLPDVYILSPVTTPVAVTLPEDTIFS